MNRSKWKFLSYDYWTLLYLKKNLKSGIKNKNLILYKRNLNILPIFFNKNIKIYNGLNSKSIKIQPSLLTEKLGSFYSTRKQYLYKKGLNLKKKKNK